MKNHWGIVPAIALLLAVGVPAFAQYPGPPPPPPGQGPGPYQNGGPDENQNGEPDYGQGDAPRHGVLHWHGDVDDTIVVILRGEKAFVRVLSGKEPRNVGTDVRGFLPPSPVRIRLRDYSGRGIVQIVRRPDPSNNFTAVVKIVDPEPGRGHYDFDLVWR